MLRKPVLMLMFFVLSTGLSAQAYISNFKGISSINNRVNLSWTIPPGMQQTSGLELQRSLDSVNFSSTYTTIYTYTGVCGFPSASQAFTVADSTPTAHRRNYYRVFVYQNSYFSNIIGVDAGERSDNYKLTPEPIVDVSKLEFTNPNNDYYVLEIGSDLGRMLYHIEGLTSNYTYIYANWFPKTGIYFFRMYKANGSGLIKGKFTVVLEQ